MKIVLPLLASVLVAVAAQAADYPDIKIADLKVAITNKTVTLIDANGTESWKKGHIPGAIDFKANPDKVASVLPSDNCS